MTVISLAMLATICQIPDFKDSSSLTCTPQSQEVRPRNPLHASPSRPSKAGVFSPFSVLRHASYEAVPPFLAASHLLMSAAFAFEEKGIISELAIKMVTSIR